MVAEWSKGRKTSTHERGSVNGRNCIGHTHSIAAIEADVVAKAPPGYEKGTIAKKKKLP